MLPRSWRLSIWSVAIVCSLLAIAAVEQHTKGWNELSHLAQVRAFDNGTPRIDAYQHTTGDRAFYHGHYYSDKAPGLGFLLTPVYAAARALGVFQPGGVGMLHLMVVFGCVLPLGVILLLVSRLLEGSDPEQRTIVAVTLAFGTLMLPFSTMLFSHVMSAAMGFGAFYLLWRERQRQGQDLRLVAAAGALGGYAIATEYPLALLVGILGIFVAFRSSPVKPVLVYGAGVAVGLMPLGLYDWWAFGSPLHVSYQYVAANSSGVLGLAAPSMWSALKLLISGRGLFVVTPVTAAAVGGMVVLWREGRRVEASISAAVCAVYFFYNTMYYLPFGGAVPGPRFLITMLPFMAVPLAAAYRRAPLATLSLAAISAATMMTATITVPILSLGWSTDTWWDRLSAGWFSIHTDLVAVFAGFALVAILAATRSIPRVRVTRRDLKLTALGLASWFAVERAVPPILAHDAITSNASGLAALLALCVALVAVLTYVARGTRLAWLAAVPLLALVLRRLDHTTLMLTLAAISIVLLVTFARPRRMAL